MEMQQPGGCKENQERVLGWKPGEEGVSGGESVES